VNEVFGMVEGGGVVPDEHEVCHGLFFGQVDAVVDLLPDGAQIHWVLDDLRTKKRIHWRTIWL
jgi:hypothetical protein